MVRRPSSLALVLTKKSWSWQNVSFTSLILSEKVLFLKKLVRINNPVLKACYDMFSHSVEFTLLCYSFDIALDLCSEVEIRSKVFSAFNHIVYSRWLLIELTVYFYCILSVLSLYCLWRIILSSINGRGNFVKFWRNIHRVSAKVSLHDLSTPAHQLDSLRGILQCS